MEMRRGLVTYLLHPGIRTGTLEEALAALRFLSGFDEFSVWEVPDRPEPWEHEPTRLLLERKELLVGTPTTFIQAGLNLAAESDVDRRAASEHLRGSLDLACRAGAQWIAIWGGLHTGDPMAARDRLADSLRPLVQSARCNGILPVLEPFPACAFDASAVETLADARAVCALVPGLRVMFDPAHHLLAGDSLPPDWDDIGYLQLSVGGRDEDGRLVDSHPMFGDPDSIGSWTDMRAVVRAAKRSGYRGPATFEVKAEGQDRTVLLPRLADLAAEVA